MDKLAPVLMCVPLSKPKLSNLLSGESVVGTGFGASKSFCTAFGVDPESEDGDRTLTWLAFLDGLRQGYQPIVAVAELASIPMDEDEFGRVAVTFALSQVRAAFVLETGECPMVTDLSLEQIWERSDVHDFMAQQDLLWYDRSELPLFA